MARRIAIVLAAALLLLSGCQVDEKAQAWRLVCEYSQYSCEGIDPPEVVHDDNADDIGAWGYYSAAVAPNMIFVNTKAVGKANYLLILVHEMTHYLQHKHQDQMPKSSCEREREAFDVEWEVAKFLNRVAHAVPWSVAKFWYGCVAGRYSVGRM